MSDDTSIHILPYTCIIGQEQLKLTLELSYIAPRIGGVLISGERGTGKSTTVRAFAEMMYGALPVTIPINATEDRVVGGWKIDELMSGNAVPQKGLLEEANGKLLYVDEVNLLDDQIVNIILDVTSTGVLVIQREGKDIQKQVQFTLVGTMNPEEGGLRPQLLDRFGLMVRVTAESSIDLRRQILRTVLAFDDALFLRQNGQSAPFLENALQQVYRRKKLLEEARQKFYAVTAPEYIKDVCVTIAEEFQAEGHRADYTLVLAAQAYAAQHGDDTVSFQHVKHIAALVLQHRRVDAPHLNQVLWSEQEERRLAELLDHADH